MSAAVVDDGTPRLRSSEVWSLVGAVVICRVLTTRACPIYDDAFITYRYARNLAEGAGLVFNPDAPWEPILGTTTPAYALLLAGLSRLGAGLVAASLTVNIACDALLAWLVMRALGWRRVASLVSVLTIAAMPYIARISVGGMEAPLFALLGLAAGASLERRAMMWAGCFAALACTVRPEGVLLVGVLVALCARRPRELARLLVPVAVIGALTIALLTAVYGDFVPQSVRAKSHMNAWEDSSAVWSRVTDILRQSFLPHPALIVCLPVVGLGLVSAVRSFTALRVVSLFALAITASYLAARPHTWGWYFYVPLTAWAVWLGLGTESTLAWLARKTRRSGLSRWGAPATWAAAAVAVLAVAGVSIRFPSPVAERVYAPMREWARETSAREPHARILAADIGALGYAWRGTVLDSEGLTWPKALEYAYPNAIIRAERPEYLMIVAERPRLGAFFDDRDVRQRYVAVQRFSARGETELEPALDRVSPTWVQDYLIYQRKRE